MKEQAAISETDASQANQKPSYIYGISLIFESGFLCVTWTVLELDQAGLKLRDPPAPASCVLGLKACTTAQLLYAVLSQMPGVAVHRGRRIVNLRRGWTT